MEWLRTHLFFGGVLGAILLFLAGIAVVLQKAPIAQTHTSLSAWGGGVAVLPPAEGVGAPTQALPLPAKPPQTMTSYATLHLPPLQEPSASTSSQNANGFDYQAFLAMLESTSTQQPAAHLDIGNTLQLSYEFLPHGLVATTSVQKARTPEQQALFDYGNKVGALVQAFEALHKNEAQVVQAQADDRTSPSKAAALKQLAADLSELGTSIQQVTPIPNAAKRENTALAQGYQGIGEKLALVPNATSDKAFVSAIEAYDKSANSFISAYVAMSQLFSAHGVTFSPADGGSVFTFSPNTL